MNAFPFIQQYTIYNKPVVSLSGTVHKIFRQFMVHILCKNFSLVFNHCCLCFCFKFCSFFKIHPDKHVPKVKREAHWVESLQLCVNILANSSWASCPSVWIWINSFLSTVGGRLTYPLVLRAWGWFCDSLNIHNFGQKGSHQSYTVVTGFKPSWKHCTDVHPFSTAYHVVLAERIKHWWDASKVAEKQKEKQSLCWRKGGIRERR